MARPLQLEAERKCILCAGASGTGKTTFALRYLVADRSLTCRFLFDAEGEFYQRLGLQPATTEDECWLAVEDGFVVFDPHFMFPGALPDGLDWFNKFSFEASSSLPGEKIEFIDEVWQHCSPNSIPSSLAVNIQTGRKRGLGMMFAAQRPNRLNESITNGVTEAVCFRLQGENALAKVAELGADPDEVASLPDGHFVSVNVARGGLLHGRLW